MKNEIHFIHEDTITPYQYMASDTVNEMTANNKMVWNVALSGDF